MKDISGKHNHQMKLELSISESSQIVFFIYCSNFFDI